MDEVCRSCGGAGENYFPGFAEGTSELRRCDFCAGTMFERPRHFQFETPAQARARAKRAMDAAVKAIEPFLKGKAV